MSKSNNPNTIRRWREVRDIHNFLRKKYRKDAVTEFLHTNYFLDETGIYKALKLVDKQPVKTPSMIWQAVMMDPNFKL